MNILKNNKIYWLVFSAGLIFLCFVQYYGLAHYRYLVPPGDDPASHYQMAKVFYNNTKGFFDVWTSGGYPPLYHLAMAEIAKLFSLDLLQTINWTYPSIIILASLSIFLCAYFLFGPYEGLAAFLLYSITAKSSLQLQFDGGFPNLLAAHVFLPLFVLFFIKVFQTAKVRQKIIFCSASLFFAVLIILTHHLSTFYLFGIVFSSLPLIALFEWITNKWSLLKGTLWMLLLCLFYAAIYLLFEKTTLFAPIRALLNYASNNFDLAGRWGLMQYPHGIGTVISLFSFFGFFYLLFSKKNWPLKIVLTMWVLILFFGSRTHMANPERMARDLVVPLSLLAGYFIVILFNGLRNPYFKIVFVSALLLFSAPKVEARINRAISYEPMIRLTSADQEAIEYLNRSNCKNVTTNELDYYLTLFLPVKNITYAFDKTLGQAQMDQSDLLYIVKNQEGWAPANVNTGLYTNASEKDFLKVAEFNSPTNSIEIYSREACSR